MIYYQKGFKYQLTKTACFKVEIYPKADIDTDYIFLTTKGDLTIRKGYAWDGASGTTIDTKSSMQGSLVHDALYQLLRMGLLLPSWRHQVDREFRNLLKADGMWWWRAELWYNGVRKLASFAANPKNKRKVYTAGR